MGIFIGSIPNNTKEDVLLANDILKQRISVENSFNLLMEKFRKLFPQKDIFLFNRGRESLYFFLKQLNLKPSDEVLTQSFTCVAVSAPILWCNSTPIYVDILKDTFNMDISDLRSKINLKTRVIVVQHTFGNISDIKDIRDIVDKINLERQEDRKIYIIEDCAHIFTNYYEKYNIGKYSDGFFFSFAQDKSISCTQGSLLVLNSLKIFENSKYEYSKIMEIEKEESEYNAKYIVLWDRIKKNYFRKIFPFSNITIGRMLVIIYRKLGLIKKQASFNSLNDSNIFKLSNIQSKLLLEQLKYAEEFNEHRKEIEEIYDSGIKEDIVFKHSSKSLLLRYPILVRNPNLIKEKLKEKGIIIGRWYTSPVFPLNDEEINTVGYKKGSCKNTEFCCKYIINLPTNIEVTKECARDIVDVVNNLAEHI